MEHRSFRTELEIALHNNKDKLTFEYEMVLDPSFIIDDRPYVVKTRKLNTKHYSTVLNYDEIIAELNTEWKDNHVYIKDMILTPPVINLDSDKPETGKIIKIDWYDPGTLEKQIKLVDSSKVYRGIMIRSCMRPIRRQVSIDHPNFLHNHPKMEGEGRIDDKHVIVDIEDWKIIKEALDPNKLEVKI